VGYSDPRGRFSLRVPCGWRAVALADDPHSTVLASFFNPEQPGAETLALYVAPAPSGVADTRGLGSPEVRPGR
jgi:hypothetical protein